MDLFVDPTRRRTVTAQLYEQLRDAIEHGRLRAGDRLPPSRQLADELGISRHTVTTAYGRLAAEGFISGNAGGGSLVADALRPPETPSPTSPGRRAPRRTAPSPTSQDADPPIVHDLTIGSPDPGLFPLVAWRRAVTWSLQRVPALDDDPAGNPDLRRAIAHLVGRSRSVQTDAAAVVVTAGALQAFDLIARALLQPGDVVAMEDPGYRLGRRCFEAIGAEVVPVPVDEQGIVVDAIPVNARLVYVTPSHQMPLGVTMSMARRRALLDLARRHGLAIIEDDYDSEHRFVDRPLEPLHRLDRGQQVVYVGTFSKTLLPALRLGFAVVPESLRARVDEVRAATLWAPPATDQLALHRLIADGTFDRHVRRTRRIYAERHRILAEQMSAHRDALQMIPTNAGLHIAAWLPAGVRESTVVATARAAGVAVTGVAEHRLRASRRAAIAIGFGGIDATAIPAAVALLADAVRRSG